MGRPRVVVVALLCVAAFLGALAVAQASKDTNDKTASAPRPLAAVTASSRVAAPGATAALPALKKKHKAAKAAPAAAAAAPAAAPVRAAPAPAPSPAPTPAPAPQPAPKPQSQGTPFLDVH